MNKRKIIKIKRVLSKRNSRDDKKRQRTNSYEAHLSFAHNRLNNTAQTVVDDRECSVDYNGIQYEVLESEWKQEEERLNLFFNQHGKIRLQDPTENNLRSLCKNPEEWDSESVSHLLNSLDEGDVKYFSNNGKVGGKFQCYICYHKGIEHTFKKKQGLQRHLGLHLEKALDRFELKRYECCHCNVKMVRLDQMKTHLEKKHQNCEPLKYYDSDLNAEIEHHTKRNETLAPSAQSSETRTGSTLPRQEAIVADGTDYFRYEYSVYSSPVEISTNESLQDRQTGPASNNWGPQLKSNTSQMLSSRNNTVTPQLNNDQGVYTMGGTNWHDELSSNLDTIYVEKRPQARNNREHQVDHMALNNLDEPVDSSWRHQRFSMENHPSKNQTPNASSTTINATSSREDSLVDPVANLLVNPRKDPLMCANPPNPTDVEEFNKFFINPPKFNVLTDTVEETDCLENFFG